jgi:2-deoxy-D-gluconate 3-dehydrogenase
VNEFGGLDILVNNAGTNRRANEPQELSMEDWRLVVDTNLTSLHIVSTAAFPHLKSSTGGKVINIGSMMSVLATGYAPAYAASKGGVVQYSKSLAVGWGRYNIQVNCILPGWVHTDMTAAFLEMFPERNQVIVDRTPAGRWADPCDLAGTAVFLASRASNFVTGASIPVDGGYLVQ